MPNGDKLANKTIKLKLSTSPFDSTFTKYGHQLSAEPPDKGRGRGRPPKTAR
jgi:hypothetical protein